MSGSEVPVIYSRNADSYAFRFLKSWKVYIEYYSIVKNLVGNGHSLEGKSILDIGCGAGQFAWYLISLGAERVVGIDSASRFVELANELTNEQEADSSKFAFYHADCSNLHEVIEGLKNEPVKQFDFVTANWVLPYAASLEQLNGFVEVASHFIKPGGKFVCILGNPRSLDKPDEELRYSLVNGFTIERVKDTHNKRIVRFYDPATGECLFSIDNYVYSIDELRNVYKQNGFEADDETNIELDKQHASEVNLEFAEGYCDIERGIGIVFSGKKMAS